MEEQIYEKPLSTTKDTNVVRTLILLQLLSKLSQGLRWFPPAPQERTARVFRTSLTGGNWIRGIFHLDVQTDMCFLPRIPAACSHLHSICESLDKPRAGGCREQVVGAAGDAKLEDFVRMFAENGKKSHE